MNVLMSDDRCGVCYGAGRLPHWESGIEGECEDCKGTGREMSDLCKELFDVLAKHFIIIRRPR